MITPSHHTQLLFSTLLNSQKIYSVSAHVHSGQLSKFPEYSAGLLFHFWSRKRGKNLLEGGAHWKKGTYFILQNFSLKPYFK